MSTLADEPVLVSTEIASLLALVAQVEDLVANPLESSELSRLRARCIEAVTQFPVSRKDRNSVAMACRLVETALLAGWSDQPAPAEWVAEAESACGQGWTGLLAALLLAPAWQIKSLPALEAAPLFLWRTLTLACFRVPGALTEMGQAEALAGIQIRRLRELARVAAINSGASALREAAEACLNGDDLRSVVSPAFPLGENLLLRGRLRAALNRRTEAVPPLAIPRAGRLLKMGVVVDQLCNDRLLRSALPWFDSLDAARFEVLVYFSGQSDQWSESYLTGRGIAFIPLVGEVSDRQDHLRAEGLDVALFALPSPGRLDAVMALLSERVAPLQGALDEFGLTSGSPAVDVAFWPSAASAGFPIASERLLIVPSAGIRLLPSGCSGEARQNWDRAGLGIPADSVVFSSAAPFALLSPEWADAAARILRDLPAAYLLIHSGAPEDAGPAGLARLCATLEPALLRHQVAATRLMISNEPLPQLAEVGALLGLADFHLDSFPLGDEQGCQLALSAGVPLLAAQPAPGFAGFAARAMIELGLPDCVAASAGELPALAVAAGKNREGCAGLRSTLRSNFESPARFHDPVALGEAVGAMLEQVFDLVAADESGARAKGQAPLVISTDSIPEGALEEGAILLEAGLAADALPRLAPWFAAQPAHSRARSLFYTALIQSGQARRALAGLRAAVDRKMAPAETWRLLARAQLGLGQPAEAMSALRMSFGYDAKHPESWSVLSEIAQASGHDAITQEVARMRTALAAGATSEAPAAPRKSLYFSPVGRQGKAFLTQMVNLFPAEQFDFLIIAYDDTDFSDLDGRIEVVRDRGQKWRLIKKHLSPEKVAAYDYVFLWDDDLDPVNFDPTRFLEILRRNQLDIAQPSLTADSFSFHPITVAQPNPVGRLTNFVEIMCPVYSSKIWASIYPYIEPDINELGWGYDLIPLGRKAIIDCMSVRHTRPGQSSQAGAAQQYEIWSHRHGIVRPALINLWSLS